MADSLHNANRISSGKVYSPRNDFQGAPAQTANMAKTADPNHLRAWRDFRKLTQEQLAESVGTTKAVISLLESGDRQLSSKWLRRLAPALNTRPGFLLDFDPEDMDQEMLSAILAVPKSSREQAIKVLKAFGTGTNG